jgi:outer membrane protein assembly factor BamE (lipoprotein component of BamABCDE complex)
MSKFFPTALSIALLFPISISAAPVEEKFERLEKEILNLHMRLSAVEKMLESSSGRIPSSVSSNKKVWRKLETGMSYDDVEKLLGEPIKIDGGRVATWYYSTDGFHSRATFIGGELREWFEPEN